MLSLSSWRYLYPGEDFGSLNLSSAEHYSSDHACVTHHIGMYIFSWMNIYRITHKVTFRKPYII